MGRFLQLRPGKRFKVPLLRKNAELPRVRNPLQLMRVNVSKE